MLVKEILVWITCVVAVACIVECGALSIPDEWQRRKPGRPRSTTTSSSLFSAQIPGSDWKSDSPGLLSVDDAVSARYACKRFQRYDESLTDAAAAAAETEGETVVSASKSDPQVVQQALHCLDVARLAPSAFNTQPCKVVLVHSAEQKLALSRFCLGPNAARVRDSDCTAVFLADRQILRTLPRFDKWLKTKNNPNYPYTRAKTIETQIYIAMFSSGYPFPRLLSAPLSFLVRTAFSILGFFTRRFYPLPTLVTAETWTCKQATLVAMAYMLACSSRRLATAPMEGIDAAGIRRVLKVPSRYSIPLIVSTGKPAKRTTRSSEEQEEDQQHRRYPLEDVVFENSFA